MMAQLRAWWMAREARERLMLGGGGVIALALILYLAIWDPIRSSADQLAGELPRLREQAAQFNRDAQEAERLRAQGAARGPAPAIATAIQDSARRAAIADAIKSVQPMGTDRAQVTMGVVAFDGFMRWLGDLGQGSGVVVESLSAKAAPEVGKVQVDALVLKSNRGQ